MAKELVELKNPAEGLVRDLKDLHEARRQKAFWEAREKEVLERVKTGVERPFGERGDCKYRVGLYAVGKVAGVNTSINREKLMERGVAPDVIDYATSRTSYFKYPVERVEE